MPSRSSGTAPLRLATYLGGRGVVTYQDLGSADADRVARLVDAAVAHYRSGSTISRVKWKSRGHEHAPGLAETLLTNRFEAGEPESIMIRETPLLDVEVALPEGVRLRRISEEADVRAMCAMVDEVFGDFDLMSAETADALRHRMTLDEWDGALDCRG